MAKGDKSTRVGGRRKVAPSASRSSVAKTPQGKRIACQGGRLGYVNGKCRGPEGQR